MLQYASELTAERGETSAWLNVRDGNGNLLSIFMDYDMAREIADLWEAMNREPEPPTYDEALAAKCDTAARMDEARALKGMV
jgi:hypothetical protein